MNWRTLSEQRSWPARLRKLSGVESRSFLLLLSYKHERTSSFVSLISFFLKATSPEPPATRTGLRRRPQRREEPAATSDQVSRKETSVWQLTFPFMTVCSDRLDTRGAWLPERRVNYFQKANSQAFPPATAWSEAENETRTTQILSSLKENMEEGAVKNVQPATNQKISFFLVGCVLYVFNAPLWKLAAAQRSFQDWQSDGRDQERIATHYTNYGAQAAQTFLFGGGSTRTLGRFCKPNFGSVFGKVRVRFRLGRVGVLPKKSNRIFCFANRIFFFGSVRSIARSV